MAEETKATEAADSRSAPPRSSLELDARRLKLIVYPALFAFIVLSSYGFYLIYNLSKDVRVLTRELSSMNRVVSANMSLMASNLDAITGHMESLPPIAANMAAITGSMGNMNHSTAAMAANTSYMQHDMRGLNRSVSGPMSMMPWNFFSPR